MLRNIFNQAWDTGWTGIIRPAVQLDLRPVTFGPRRADLGTSLSARVPYLVNWRLRQSSGGMGLYGADLLNRRMTLLNQPKAERDTAPTLFFTLAHFFCMGAAGPEGAALEADHRQPRPVVRPPPCRAGRRCHSPPLPVRGTSSRGWQGCAYLSASGPSSPPSIPTPLHVWAQGRRRDQHHGAPRLSFTGSTGRG